MRDKKNTAVKKPRRRLLKIILAIVLVLVIFRLALPYIVLRYANKALAGLPGYYGHVQDIDIALIRGGYQLDNLFLNKVDSVTQAQTTLLKVETIDLSVEWKALFKGALVGEVIFERPMLRFTKDRAEPNDVKEDTTDFRILLDKFMPLNINRFEIIGGVLAYHDSTSKPVVSLELTNTNVLAQNLRTVYDKNDVLPATVDMNAYLYKGSLDVKMKLNPLAKHPTFDLNTELKNTNLPEMNEFFKAYGKFDVSRGTFGLFSEMAAKDNKFKGYVKPVITNLDILGPEDRKDGLLHKMWEGFVGAIGVVFRNQPKDQIATKVPIEGTFKAPDAGITNAIVQVIINAFIQALIPSIDNEISLKSLNAPVQEEKGFLGKLFSKDNKDQKDKREERKEERKERKSGNNK